jgi:hypothetical protein
MYRVTYEEEPRYSDISASTLNDLDTLITTTKGVIQADHGLIVDTETWTTGTVPTQTYHAKITWRKAILK